MKDNQVNTDKALGYGEQTLYNLTLANSNVREILGKSGRKQIKVLARELDTDLPIYHLPDGEIHIGLRPPTPWERGFGT